MQSEKITTPSTAQKSAVPVCDVSTTINDETMKMMAGVSGMDLDEIYKVGHGLKVALTKSQSVHHVTLDPRLQAALDHLHHVNPLYVPSLRQKKCQKEVLQQVIELLLTSLRRVSSSTPPPTPTSAFHPASLSSPAPRRSYSKVVSPRWSPNVLDDKTNEVSETVRRLSTLSVVQDESATQESPEPTPTQNLLTADEDESDDVFHFDANVVTTTSTHSPSSNVSDFRRLSTPTNRTATTISGLPCNEDANAHSSSIQSPSPTAPSILSDEIVIEKTWEYAARNWCRFPYESFWLDCEAELNVNGGLVRIKKLFEDTFQEKVEELDLPEKEKLTIKALHDMFLSYHSHSGQRDHVDRRRRFSAVGDKKKKTIDPKEDGMEQEKDVSETAERSAVEYAAEPPKKKVFIAPEFVLINAVRFESRPPPRQVLKDALQKLKYKNHDHDKLVPVESTPAGVCTGTQPLWFLTFAVHCPALAEELTRWCKEYKQVEAMVANQKLPLMVVPKRQEKKINHYWLFLSQLSHESGGDTSVFSDSLWMGLAQASKWIADVVEKERQRVGGEVVLRRVYKKHATAVKSSVRHACLRHGIPAALWDDI